MIILFVFGLLLGATAVVFAFQNIATVTVTFFSWQLTGSLSLIILLSMVLGVLVAFLLILPESIDSYRKYKSLERQNKTLEEDLRKQKELTVFAKHTAPTAEVISKIEHGAIEDSPSVIHTTQTVL